MKMRISFLLALIFLARMHLANAAPVEWGVDYNDGVPATLHWQSETGYSYDLWYTEDLSVPFTHVDGFPKSGNGLMIEHPFEAGLRGFFKITSEPAPLDGFALIAAGSFEMGDSLDGMSNAPVHSVHVSAFYMAKHEVTMALWNEVRAWGLENGYTDLPMGRGKGPNHPVIIFSWHAMVKWCNARSEMDHPQRAPCYRVSGAVYRTGDHPTVVCDWNADGYRLPTEAEWEKAARGGLNGKRFPWGDTISHSRANYYSSSSYSYDLSPTRGFDPVFNDGEHPFTAPVGSFEPNGYGLYDMVGNVLEWCWDLYGSYSLTAQTDPRGPTSGSDRVYRGGTWGSHANDTRCASRSWDTPTGTHNDVGFRLATLAVQSSCIFWMEGFGVTVSDPQGDDDFDGWPNLSEHLLNTDPTLAGSTPETVVSHTDTHFEIRMADPISRPDVLLGAQSSTDTINWSDENVIPTENGFAVPVDGVQRFLRLSITLTESP